MIMKQAFLVFLALGLFCLEVSFADELDSKQGTFSNVEDSTSPAKRKVIATFQSPSELSCSQKCLHHEGCKYKKYNLSTKQCDLMQEFCQEDLQSDVLLTKKETSINKAKATSQCMKEPGCGENCIEKPDESQANKIVCDCRKQGVYDSCNAALLSSCFLKAVYWIFPKTIAQLMAVQCTTDPASNNSFAVFHHDSEAKTYVNGYEDLGSYQRKIRYHKDMNSIIKIVNQSSQCQQYTKLDCYAAGRLNIRLNFSYTYLSGRNGKELEYWGGGLSNGSGCACGIDGSCAVSSQQCNCDANDEVLRKDEGFVTKKEDLPIVAVTAGDTGSSFEILYHTVGPLMCTI